jgi:hypothetical protein
MQFLARPHRPLRSPVTPSATTWSPPPCRLETTVGLPFSGQSHHHVSGLGQGILSQALAATNIGSVYVSRTCAVNLKHLMTHRQVAKSGGKEGSGSLPGEAGPHRRELTRSFSCISGEERVVSRLLDESIAFVWNKFQRQ